MARQRRKDWEQIVAAYPQSGLTQEAFARRQGMPVGTLRAWIYRRAGRRAPRLLPVRVRAMAPEIAVELRLPSGVAMRIAVDTDPAYITALLRALA